MPELSTRQAAAYLGVNERRVRALIVEGRIAARKITPRLWLIDEKKLQRFAATDRDRRRKSGNSK